MNQQPSTWEIAADDVLAVLLNEPAAFDDAVYNHGLTAAAMPTQEHAVTFAAIHALRREDKPTHDTLVLDRCGGGVSAAWLSQRIALYDILRTGKVFTENVHLLMRYSDRRYKLDKLQEAATALRDGGNLDVIVPALMTFLASDGRRTITAETAGEHGGSFAEYMLGEPEPTVTTGIPWIDERTGGFIRGRIWWIGGPYKSRKTTLALNMLLSYCLMNPTMGGAILSKEVYTEDINAQLVAMLANGYLHRAGLYRSNDNLISGDNLRLARIGYKRWGKHQAEAVDWGINQYKLLKDRMRVYDSRPEKGGLIDIASIQRVVKRDISLYNGSVFFVDYLQLFGAKGDSLYERVSNLARGLQEMTGQLNITTVVVAQLNEESIKSEGNSYSPGVKGGGDPAQTANYFLTTQYKQGEYEHDDTRLMVQMKLSRHGQGGTGVKEPLDIHPGSGLLLESNWIKGRA